MAVYFIYGRLGSGKTLVATARAFQAHGDHGVPLALNYPIYVEHSPYPYAAAPIYRLPDYPTIEDFRELPACKVDGSITTETIGELETWDPEVLRDYLGGYNETKQGVLVLDEASHYLGSREWSDKERKKLVVWLTQVRKYGWHVYLLVQSINMIDKQVREALAEHTVECKRLDRVAIPLLTRLSRFLVGFEIRPPRVHVGIVRYGTSLNSQIVDRWFIRGKNLFRAYDTRYVFRRESGHNGLWHMLSPYQYYGRLVPPWLHFIKMFLQSIVDFHNEWVKPVRVYVIITVSFFVGWLSSENNWFTAEDITQVSSAVAEQLEIEKDPWSGVNLVMEFGSIRKYEKNGEPVPVKHRIVAGVDYYCIEDSCRN